MRTGWLFLCLWLLNMGWPPGSRADVWDTSGSATQENDDTPDTHNELVHGSDQLHDLGARPGFPSSVADQDWYTVSSKPWASYEAVVDATGGDIGAPTLQLFNELGTFLLGSGVPVGSGFSYSLRWQNTTSAPVSHRVRVMSGFCSTDCTPDDVYRIRFYETTYAAGRFNNYQSQVTVLLLQNAAAYTVSGARIYFWSVAGAALATYGPIDLTPKALLSLDTSGIGGLDEASGSITISHGGRYGDLAGKAVAVEPSTGFSFDTPVVSRPH